MGSLFPRFCGRLNSNECYEGIAIDVSLVFVLISCLLQLGCSSSRNGTRKRRSWNKFRTQSYVLKAILCFFLVLSCIFNIGYQAGENEEKQVITLSSFEIVDHVLRTLVWSLVMFQNFLHHKVKTRDSIGIQFFTFLAGGLSMIPIYRLFHYWDHSVLFYNQLISHGLTTLMGILVVFEIIFLSNHHNTPNDYDKNLFVPFIEDHEEELSPLDQAGIFSLLTYSWFTPLIKLGYKKQFDMRDIPPLPNQDNTYVSAKKFESRLTEEKTKNEDASMLRMMRKLYGREIMLFGIWSAMNKAISLSGPVLLKEFLSWADSKDKESINFGVSSITQGYLITGMLCVRSLIEMISTSQYNLAWQRFDLRIRAGLLAAIYHKTLHLSALARHTTGLGRITNLISVDVGRMIGIPTGLFDAILIPIDIVVVLYLLNQQVSYAFVAGLSLVTLMIPLQAFLGKKIQTVTREMLAFRDERVGLCAESLGSIRTLKLFGWVECFSRKLEKQRSLEMGKLRIRKYLDAFCVFFWATTPVLAQVAVFVTAIYMGKDLNAANAFTAVALIDRLIFPMNYFPWIINSFLEARVSALRVRDYLFNAEEKPLPEIVQCEEKGNVVELSKKTFDWSTDTFQLKNISLRFKQGEVVLVCGQVGSGKSSLLLSILGEMNGLTSSCNALQTISYAPQTPWVFSGTLKENILFGETYSRERYERVCGICHFHEDLETMKRSDTMEIGDNGINLSGGQKLRLGLARCLYQSAPLYLLDDPFSSIGGNLSQSILNSCIDLSIQENSTMVIVTHSLHLLDNLPNKKKDILKIVLMHEGEIVEQGSFKELVDKKKGRFAAALHEATNIHHHKDTETKEEEEEDTETKEEEEEEEEEKKKKECVGSLEWNQLTTKKDTEDSLVKEEKREKDVVRSEIWYKYAEAIGLMTTLAILLSLMVMQSSKNGLDLWLSYFTTHHEMNPYTFVHGLLVLAGANTLAAFGRSFFFAYGGLEAAKTVYAGLMNRILHAPIAFFDATPLGRILNRLSGDIYSVDESLPFILNIFLKDVAGLVGSIIIVLYGNPYLSILFVVLSFVYYSLQSDYRPTSRHTKRLDSVAQSPLFSHFNETLQGLFIIRAMKKNKQVSLEYMNHLNASQRMSFANANAGAWFGLRLDVLGVGVTNFIVIFAVVQYHLGQQVNPGVLGLTLTYAIPIVSQMNSILGTFITTEKEMIAVERIQEYATIDTETLVEVHSSDASSDVSTWPTHGNIQVNSLYVRYEKSKTYAVKNLSLTIKGSSKVGICGNSGAGKSSFLLSFFRMVPYEGEILIDHQNIKSVPLDYLRKVISCIPQQPILFRGTLRSNLDPEGVYTDELLWNALRKTGMLDFVQSIQDKLEMKVEEGGVNMSLGQLQLFCLARALLQTSKVVFIDEATSSVDVETEALIVQTIRESFKEATVFTIAHRLQAILESDVILVFHEGRLVEMGSPSLLSHKKSGYFAEMRAVHHATSKSCRDQDGIIY